MDPQGRNYKSILQQVWIGVISSFGVISTGMSLGFSAVALPQLQNSSHLDYLDVNQASWFAARLTRRTGVVVPGGPGSTELSLAGFGHMTTPPAL
uniref:Uncharacterized protein n=1 Tax=Timema douglasi TaxID=61478 RepID=A0A7R8VV99_TIMDO|nr:unnamed protein product [Timema douglasi]